MRSSICNLKFWLFCLLLLTLNHWFVKTLEGRSHLFSTYRGRNCWSHVGNMPKITETVGSWFCLLVTPHYSCLFCIMRSKRIEIKLFPLAHTDVGHIRVTEVNSQMCLGSVKISFRNSFCLSQFTRTVTVRVRQGERVGLPKSHLSMVTLYCNPGIYKLQFPYTPQTVLSCVAFPLKQIELREDKDLAGCLWVIQPHKNKEIRS